MQFELRRLVELQISEPYLPRQMYGYYQEFYRLDYDIPGGWRKPLERTRRGVKPLTKGSLLMRAYELADGDLNDLDVPLFGGNFKYPGTGKPMHEMEVWATEHSRDNEASPEFVLSYEDAWTMAEDH
jgi:hypothetical protein